MHPLDHPKITSRLFYPRKAPMGTSPLPNVHDGLIPTEDDDVALGYRLFVPAGDARCLVLFFHGNGETAPDYDSIAQFYLQLGMALLVVDYRGYGWSTGEPQTTKLLTDGDAVMKALPVIRTHRSLDDVPLFVMGRSLGSGPAIYLGEQYPQQFKGMIIESGFAETPSLFQRLGIQIDLSQLSDLPVNNAKRLSWVQLPLLVIHGDLDMILPLEHGQQLFEASPVKNKTFLRIPSAGHNDILLRAADSYFTAISDFVDGAIS